MSDVSSEDKVMAMRKVRFAFEDVRRIAAGLPESNDRQKWKRLELELDVCLDALREAGTQEEVRLAGIERGDLYG